MSRLEDIPEPWRSFLREIDGIAKEEVQMKYMGEFVVTQLYGFSRPTSDIDTLSITPVEVAGVIASELMTERALDPTELRHTPAVRQQSSAAR